MVPRQFAHFRAKLFCKNGWLLLGLLPAALFGASLAGTSDRAEARARGEPAATAKKPAKTDHGPILAVVSLAKQRIWVYGRAGLIAQSAVSTGMAGHRTPTGVFSVIQKNRFHRSNIYSNAPMPYMQRITWSGVALHAGVVPGHPASHGCIRLPHQFAVEFWGMTRIGARVVVVPHDASVVDIEHARLPVPTLTPAPEEEDNQRDKLKVEAHASRDPSADIVGVSLAESPREIALPAARLLNPLDRAKAGRVLAIADAAAKAKAAKAAVEASALKAAEASRTIAALRAAELTLTTARAKRDAAANAIDGATTPETTERAKSTLTAAEGRLAEAEKAAEEARAVEAARTPESFAAAKTAWISEKASNEAAAARKATEHGAEPISIFISKKAGRVYIRQAWAPIHEAPITFDDAEAPVGTHTYLAMAPEGDGKTMRWLSVSIPPSPAVAQARQGAKRGAQERPVSVPVARSMHPEETAASVLERFVLPEETRTFIEDRLWTGASLTVSDEGISNETGTYTDFIVLTR